eukprot:1295494-Lingulodinium_polyedra.AAC.1
MPSRMLLDGSWITARDLLLPPVVALRAGRLCSVELLVAPLCTTHPAHCSAQRTPRAAGGQLVH